MHANKTIKFQAMQQWIQGSLANGFNVAIGIDSVCQIHTNPILPSNHHTQQALTPPLSNFDLSPVLIPSGEQSYGEKNYRREQHDGMHASSWPHNFFARAL
jgi:hypothetical protein